MASISISQTLKTVLDKYKTGDASRNSYNEVVQFLVDHLESHQAFPFTLKDMGEVMNSVKGDAKYRYEMDFNKDGKITSIDLGLASKAGVPSGQPVPEPTPEPTPTPTPSTLPIRAAIIIPKDYPLDKWFFGNPPADPDKAIYDVVDGQIRKFRTFLETQAKLTFDYELVLHHSNLTAVEIGTSPETGQVILDNNYPLAVIPEGQGAHETVVFEKIIGPELGWGTLVASKRYFRHWAFVLNAGGWAGGRHGAGEIDGDVNHPFDNWGQFLIGDWQLRASVTGKNDPFCAVYYGDTPVPSSTSCSSPGGAWSHEALHSLNVHCHQGDLLPDGTRLPVATFPLDLGGPGTILQPGQIVELTKYNLGSFLRQV